MFVDDFAYERSENTLFILMSEDAKVQKTADCQAVCSCRV